MRLINTILFAIGAISISGCSSIPDKAAIQQILNATLPPTFEGDRHVDHQNPWVQFSGDFYGLRKDKTTGLWTWTGFRYAGHSAITATNVSDLPPRPFR